MSSFFKGLWSRTKKAPELRVLSHPRELEPEDMIQMANHFGLPEALRDQSFKVIGISTYQFEHGNSPCFTLEGTSDKRINLTIESDAGRETAAFSLGIKRNIVEEMFDLDEFSEIFDGDGGASLTLVNDAGMSAWVGGRYFQQANGERGYYYEKDFRGSVPPEHEDEGEPFEYYLLVSDDESHGVEIEVFAGGETEVSLVIYVDLEMISGLWPAEQAVKK
ncbi:MAG: hypothetical protein VB957_02705 [Pseudomonadales bacterium]|jgi:hypothetical protein